MIGFLYGRPAIAVGRNATSVKPRNRIEGDHPSSDLIDPSRDCAHNSRKKRTQCKGNFPPLLSTTQTRNSNAGD
ncbi:Hypothetical Protein RRSL_03508 [Ralstonia solanacearum UW551]|uniref:Uncharacterized protein n=1 Tax=Ralstonia solanacearum (strain UW551) TaxID=342110 RepID=A0AB33VJ15_RALSU|nr:Hypothetical Protein RRSL_03508 [Ralstonia solanacearum UW551]